MKKVVAGIIVLAGLAAAGLLADQAVERDREYRRLIVQGDEALEPRPDVRGHRGLQRRDRAEARFDARLPEARRGASAPRRYARDAHRGAEGFANCRGARSGRHPHSRKAGRRQQALHRYGNAAENYEAYLRLDDHSAPLFYKLALASRGDGRLTRAIVALQQAVTLNPSFHEAHYVLGLCLQRSRRAR